MVNRAHLISITNRIKLCFTEMHLTTQFYQVVRAFRVLNLRKSSKNDFKVRIEEKKYLAAQFCIQCSKVSSKTPLMASLRSFLTKRCLTYNEVMMTRRLVSTEPIIDSHSFAQRLRDLPKDLLDTKIKREVYQVVIHNCLQLIIFVFSPFLLVFDLFKVVFH